MEFYETGSIDLSVEDVVNAMSSAEKEEMQRVLLGPTKDSNVSTNGHTNGYTRELQEIFTKILDSTQINHLALVRELEDRYNL